MPGYVQREFEDYLKWGRLEHGFLRVRCESSHVEHLVAFSCKRRGFEPVFSYIIHYIAHEGFRDVIGNFCEEEAESVREYHQDTHALLPFKQEI